MRAKRATSARDEIVVAIDSFRRILRELRVLARRGELSSGLTPAQLFVLTIVAERPGASVNEIAAATLTDRSSAAAVVERLAGQGYVRRRQALADRRRAEITITTAGRRAMKGASPPPTVALLSCIRALAPSERAALAKGLSALTREMGVADRRPGMLFDEPPGRIPRSTK